MNLSNSITQRLLSGSALVAAGKLLAGASALMLNIILTRSLAPKDIGVYYLLVSIVTICGLAAQLGVHQAIVQALASSIGTNREGGVRRSIRAAFLIVIFGVVSIVLPYALGVGQWLEKSVLDSPAVANISVITALWISGFALRMLISQIFRGFHRIGLATLFEGISDRIFFFIGLAYIWSTQGHLDLREVLMITLGALFLTVASGLILFRKLYIQTKSAVGIDIRGMLKVSLPIFVSSMAIIGTSELHILILGGVKYGNGVAIYGAVYRLAKFILIPLFIINSVIPPMVAQLVAQKRMKEAERVLRSTAAIVGVPVIMILVITILAGAPILSFLYGEFYAQGANILIVLVVAQTINTLTGSPGVLLMMSHHQSIVMKLALIGGVLGIITSLMLVKPLGPNGVAFGVAVGGGVHNLGMWAYCKYKLNVNTHMSLLALRDVMGIMWRKVSTKC